MVLINHLPPLIMSQLLVIYHHFQSHACREIQREKKKNKHSWLTRWLFLRGYVKCSKMRLSHSKGFRSQYCNMERGDFSPGDFSYLVCHSLRVKYLDDMRTFLLPDMFIQARFSTITHSHLSPLEVSSNDRAEAYPQPYDMGVIEICYICQCGCITVKAHQNEAFKTSTFLHPLNH